MPCIQLLQCHQLIKCNQLTISARKGPQLIWRPRALLIRHCLANVSYLSNCIGYNIALQHLLVFRVCLGKWGVVAASIMPTSMIERPKMTCSMYQALKRHIMNERNKKKQGIFSLNFVNVYIVYLCSSVNVCSNRIHACACVFIINRSLAFDQTAPYHFKVTTVGVTIEQIIENGILNALSVCGWYLKLMSPTGN